MCHYAPPLESKGTLRGGARAANMTMLIRKDAKPPDKLASLTPRRRAILELVSQGLTNDRIALSLGISAGTVRIQVSNIISQLGVNNRAEASAMFATSRAQPANLERVLARPAIAVLPIAGPRGRGARLAAGMTWDITSLFARWCAFPVIARLSASHSRGRGSAAEIGRFLGARFLVDGALRVHGDGWRFEVSIADAEQGTDVWSGRYDFLLRDVFTIEDSVCEAVVAAANPALLKRIGARVPVESPTADLPAWELAHQGLALEAVRESAATAQARKRLGAAIERDPRLALAHFGLGLVSYSEVLNQWAPKEVALESLSRSADQCIALAPGAAEGYYLRGRHFQATGRPDQAIAPLEEAVGHNPSFAPAHALLAQVLILAGSSDEGIARMKHAVRLDPHAYVAGLAAAHFSRRAYAEGLVEAERAVTVSPNYAFARVLAIACAFWAGDRRRAAAHMTTLREGQPGFDPDGFLRTFGPNDVVARVAEALKALR